MDPRAAPPAAVSLSVVIEWENAGRIGAARAGLMLAALRDQLAAAPWRFDTLEMLLLHSGKAEDIVAIEDAVHIAGIPFPWQLIRSADGSYAGQKYHGARLARGEILLMLDSDVVPQPGWLDGLISPFKDPETKIVCGETFVEHSSFYSAAMALGWLFPLRSSAAEVIEVDWFHANNFAIRRDIFLAQPETGCGGLRDGTIRMVEMLQNEGHKILLNRRAAVAHPPPEGVRGFAVRALWSGVDNALRWKRRRSRTSGAKVLLLDSVGAWMRVARQYKRVGFGPLKAFAAGCLLSVYYSLRLLAYASALIAPKTTRRVLNALDA